jgi:hypothetical protein
LEINVLNTRDQLAGNVDTIKAMQSGGYKSPEMLARFGFGYGQLGLTCEPSTVRSVLKSALGA